jgi:small subunit ribosomal protein S9
MSSLNLPASSTITGLSTVNPAQEEKPAQLTRKVRPPVQAKNGWWWGTGRRKRAVARVRLKPATGEGKVQIQVGKDTFKSVEQYFAEPRDRHDVVAPLNVAGLAGKFDVVARCSGGGYMGQAQAVRLGLARALRDYDPNLEEAMRNAGFLTRDAREVERKKYGQAGARRRFQFSKR